MAITITESAAQQVQRILADKQLELANTNVRLAAKGGGCSGFSYLIDLDTAGPKDSDKVCESQGVKILVDKKSYFYLNGTEVDFEQSMLGGQFKFKNPNASGTCGCGTSFSVG